MSATDDTPGGSSALDATPSAYQEVQASPEFVSLRRRWRGFIFTMSAVFLGWFLVYVLLSDFAHGVVDTRIGGTNFTVGLLLGLLQFVSTFTDRDDLRPLRQQEPGRRRRGAAAARGGEPVSTQIGSPALNIGIFALFVVVTLVIVYRVSRASNTASDYYAAGSSFTGPQNGIAISGDYLSAASFLGIAGAIAVNGYDGFLYSIGFLVAWLTALLLVAELLRNVGRFTMGDVLSFRMRQRPVRAAAAVSTLLVSFFYLLAQMAGAGGLISLLLGVKNVPGTPFDGQSLVIAVVGILMVVYVLYGGMRGTTWVQIIKAALLVIGAAVMTVWVLGLYGFNLSALLGSAVEQHRQAAARRRQPVRQDGRRRRSTSCRCPSRWCSAPPVCRTS